MSTVQTKAELEAEIAELEEENQELQDRLDAVAELVTGGDESEDDDESLWRDVVTARWSYQRVPRHLRRAFRATRLHGPRMRGHRSRPPRLKAHHSVSSRIPTDGTGPTASGGALC
jgi:hypothetical protein